VKPKGLVAIEDADDLVRQVLERWLEEAGYWATAGPGRSAALVIVDVPSPRSAQARLEALRREYAAPILVLSGRFRRGLARSAEAARRLGVEMVLPKPFTREELLSAVDEALGEGE
jgi:CheY-like chemotaxis protein